MLVGIDEHDAEGATAEHPIERTLTLSDGESLSLIIPSERNLRETALLVVVVVALIFIKGELPVSTWIDADFKVVPVALLAVLYLRSPRHDGTLRHIERHECQIDLTLHGLTAFILLSCPQINPVVTLRQIDAALGSL